MGTLRGFGSMVRQVGLAIAGIGAAAIAGIGVAVKHFADFGSALNDVSERTGVAASKLAAYQYAAEQTGATLEDVEKAILKAEKAGLNFDKVADQIAKTADPAQKVRIAFEAFGRAGPKLIPMLNNLRALREEAQKKGLVPTDASIRMADELGDKFGTIFQQLKMQMFEIGATVAPVLLPVLDAIQDILASSIQWIRTNSELINSLGGIGDAIIGGDWSLAGKIAVKELQIAFQMGVVEIADMVGGTLGDALGTLGTQLVEGDLEGAWKTVTDGMTATWDSWLVGVESAFKTMVDGLKVVWDTAFKFTVERMEKMADLIENLPARMSAAATAAKAVAMGGINEAIGNPGGFLGDGKASAGFKAFLEQNPNLDPNAQSTMGEFLKKNPQFRPEQLIDELKGGQRLASQGVGSAVPNPQAMASAAAEALRNAAATTATAGAVGSAGLGLVSNATGEEVKKQITKAMTSSSGFLGGVAGGASEAQDALDRMREELTAMRNEAKEARDAAMKRFEEGKAGLGTGEMNDLAKSSFVTFSASAAAYMGGSGDRATKQRDELIRLEKEGIKKQDELNRKIDKLGAMGAVIA